MYNCHSGSSNKNEINSNKGQGSNTNVVSELNPSISTIVLRTILYNLIRPIYIYLLKYSTCTCAEIGQYFGFNSSAIKAINSGRNHHLDNIQYPIRAFRGKSNSQSVEAILAKRSTKAIDTSLEM